MMYWTHSLCASDKNIIFEKRGEIGKRHNFLPNDVIVFVSTPKDEKKRLMECSKMFNSEIIPYYIAPSGRFIVFKKNISTKEPRSTREKVETSSVRLELKVKFDCSVRQKQQKLPKFLRRKIIRQMHKMESRLKWKKKLTKSSWESMVIIW